MTKFDQEKAFIIKRESYREQQYLVDIFHCNLGRFRASVRIPKGKRYRKTNNFSLFQEVLITGHRKHDLATIWLCEPQHTFHLKAQELLQLYYLNELLLTYLLEDDPAPTVYQSYKHALSTSSVYSFRHFEYQLVTHLGLLPEICGESTEYLLIFNQHIPTLIPLTDQKTDKKGFSKDLIIALQINDIPKIICHAQAKALFQGILNQQYPLKHLTRSVVQGLKSLG